MLKWSQERPKDADQPLEAMVLRRVTVENLRVPSHHRSPHTGTALSTSLASFHGNALTEPYEKGPAQGHTATGGWGLDLNPEPMAVTTLLAHISALRASPRLGGLSTVSHSPRGADWMG